MKKPKDGRNKNCPGSFIQVPSAKRGRLQTAGPVPPEAARHHATTVMKSRHHYPTYSCLIHRSDAKSGHRPLDKTFWAELLFSKSSLLETIKEMGGQVAGTEVGAPFEERSFRPLVSPGRNLCWGGGAAGTTYVATVVSLLAFSVHSLEVLRNRVGYLVSVKPAFLALGMLVALRYGRHGRTLGNITSRRRRLPLGSAMPTLNGCPLNPTDLFTSSFWRWTLFDGRNESRTGQVW